MISYPVIVDEHGDISTYDSLEDAGIDLEVVDVTNDEFFVYDSEGKVLELEIVSSFLGPEKVRVKEPDIPIERKGDLRNALENFLANCEEIEAQSLSSMTFEDLIKRVRIWSD